MKRHTKKRTGVATVEMAITLPLMLFFFLASVEISSRVNLKQSATAAAYESARRASANGGTKGDAISAFNDVATVRGINNAQIQFQPDSNWTRGQPIAVTVRVPITNNLWIDNMFGGQDIQSTVVFVRQ